MTAHDGWAVKLKPQTAALSRIVVDLDAVRCEQRHQRQEVLGSVLGDAEGAPSHPIDPVRVLDSLRCGVIA